MDKNAIVKLDARIAELERRVTQLKALRSVLEDDLIAVDLAEVFQDQPPPSRIRKTVLNKTAVKIKEFFDAQENGWATVKELVAATKSSKDSIRQVLYKTNKDLFDRVGQRGFRRETRFRLKENGAIAQLHEQTQ